MLFRSVVSSLIRSPSSRLSRLSRERSRSRCAEAARGSATSATAQRDRDRSRDNRDSRDDGDLIKLDTTIAFGANGTVDLSQVSGTIVVTAWNKKEARISAHTEYGYLRADLSSNRISLEVRSRRGRMGDSEFRLQVPVGTRVIARSVSGDITVSGTKAAAELRSVSGDVELGDAVDQVTLESVSGSVKADP